MTLLQKFQQYIIPELKILKESIKDLKEELDDSKKMCQRFEDLLTDKNAQCTQAQALHITDHAIHRYRERGGFKGTDDELRKKIYKLLARHLLRMDKLSDGEYDLDKNVVCRVKDNTAVTCMRRRGSTGNRKLNTKGKQW